MRDPRYEAVVETSARSADGRHEVGKGGGEVIRAALNGIMLGLALVVALAGMVLDFSKPDRLILGGIGLVMVWRAVR